MGLLDRLLGREEVPEPQRGSGYGGRPYGQPDPPNSDDMAIERYRYLLRTAPPETIEQAHAEAFARLTPEQRREVLAQLASEVPDTERPTSDDPRTLARAATRAEMRSPGTLERSFGGPMMGGAGMGMGGMIAGSLLASVAGAFIGTAIADSMFDMSDGGGYGDEMADGGAGGEDMGSGGDGGGDYGGDFGGGDLGGGDFGGGDFGGEF